jgi:hypothetical protein
MNTTLTSTYVLDNIVAGLEQLVTLGNLTQFDCDTITLFLGTKYRTPLHIAETADRRFSSFADRMGN